jgi:hypothetical protein
LEENEHSMEQVSYARFQQALGDIIIRWAIAEEHFRQLLSVTSGLAPLEGEIVFGKVSASNQRYLLARLGELRHSAEARDDLAYCSRLHEVNGANRNLFAHGHIGFGTIDGGSPYAQCVKLHLGSRPHTKMWEVPFYDILQIAAQISEFDRYVSMVAARLPCDRDTSQIYVAGLHRPGMPKNYAATGVDLDALMWPEDS